MRSLSDTISRLGRLRAMGSAAGRTEHATHLEPLAPPATNPGALDGFVHVPAGLTPGAALVVVLHGCTQTAAGYDEAAGWSQLADQHGFVVLFPQQTRSNNGNLCFNWFSPEDTRRDGGEAASIHAMVRAVATTHPIDPARIFVTGLSAGGAMAAVMLATYPEVFAAGAVVAGLPFGSAAGVPEAFDRMRGHNVPSGDILAAAVRAASPHAGPWPRLQVWHGSTDNTVSPANAAGLIEQWRGIHGLAHQPDRADRIDGYPRRTWLGADGAPVIEDYSITGMGHGTPLSPGDAEGIGASAPYMLDVGISSTHHIARFFGILDAVADRAAAPHNVPAIRPRPAAAPEPAPAARPTSRPTSAPTSRPASGPGRVIEDALRAAGLMR